MTAEDKLCGTTCVQQCSTHRDSTVAWPRSSATSNDATLRVLRSAALNARCATVLGEGSLLASVRSAPYLSSLRRAEFGTDNCVCPNRVVAAMKWRISVCPQSEKIHTQHFQHHFTITRKSNLRKLHVLPTHSRFFTFRQFRQHPFLLTPWIFCGDID